MARGCSDSDSEEERHDRFKSERNPSSAAVSRSNIPSSLDTYSSRARSPLRQNSHKVSRHRSRYSEERRYSPHRRVKSPVRRDFRDNRSPKENKDRSSSSERKHSKHRHKKSHDKFRSERYEEEPRKRPIEDVKYSDHKRTEINERLSDRNRSVDKESRVSIHDNNDSENKDCNEKKVKKHKRSHERSQNHDGKKRKKEKKHKRKHEKKKSDKESFADIINVNMSCDSILVEDSIDLTKDLKNSGDDLSNSDENEVSPEKLSGPSEENSPERVEEVSVDAGSEQEEGEVSGSESEQCFGPALPPGTTKTEMMSQAEIAAVEDVEQYGPALPPRAAEPDHESPEEEEDVTRDLIGPLPLGIVSAAQSALDARASILKVHMDNKPKDEDGKKRETWMLELPEVRGAQLGLGPRKFRANPAPDMSDRSSWTDTPEEKAKKNLLGGKEELCEFDTKKLEILERNKEMELLAKKSEKKSKSLLDMHQKELKKKKKKEEKLRGGKPAERIPFSRENDLQTNKFDEAQKRSIIKKAQFLDSRFSSGESKFL